MIKVGSKAWEDITEKLEHIHQKSNRDVICLDCWQIFNYDQKVRHLRAYPEHKSRILTSKYFSSPDDLLRLCRETGRIETEGTTTSIQDPFAKSKIAFKRISGEVPEKDEVDPTSQIDALAKEVQEQNRRI